MDELDGDDIKAFLAESYDNINQIENYIIDLEKTSTNTESLVDIYRYLHTIKGNCGFLAFSKLETLAHAGETLLGKLREGKLKINTQITTALLQTIDSIREILNNIEASNSEGNNDYSGLIKKLIELGSREWGVGSGEQEVRGQEGQEGQEEISFSPSSLPSSSSPTPHSLLPTPSIRVDIELLDRMMNLVGELVLTRNQVLQFAGEYENAKFTAVSQKLNLISSELQFGVMKTRMQSINIILQKLPRVIRDLAYSCGKEVQAEISGAETEIDRSIIEVIKDPIMHLVRNCIDHGIETPDVRTACGKSRRGKLYLRAFHEGGRVNIEIGDDGKGIEWKSIKEKALSMSLITAMQAESLTQNEVENLIFAPGLSTSTHITNLSGRGIGMDIVKTNIEKVNGTIQVYSQQGKGTTFKIKIPLTLAIIPALIIESSEQYFTIPQENIQELVRLENEEIHTIETLYNIPVLRLRGTILPVVSLNHVLELKERNNSEAETIYIVVIKIEDYHFGLIVDRIEDTQDIVVKPLGKQLKVKVFTGATILGDGKVALILDAIALANQAGITPQVQQRLFNRTTPTDTLKENHQLILLFQGVENSRMGIPISEAYRLEEFPLSSIEVVGNQKVIQNRGEVLPLIDLNAIFSDSQPEISKEKVEVIVVTLGKHHYGLIVNQILDIVKEPLSILGSPTRPGIKTLAVIQNQITEILDVENTIRMTLREWGIGSRE
jgi:two-component system, chemotaxis family, sensor kinase CheA